MPLPQVLKSGPFWSGVGTIGTGGTGVTVWHVWDSNHPTGDRRLSKDGYTFNPITTDIGAIAGSFGGKPLDDQFSLSGQGCFQNFFPNVTVSNGSLKQEVSNPGDETTFKISDPSDKSSSPNAIGCAILQFDYKNKDSFVFKSEITVKNDKVGWVLWVGSGGESVDSGGTTTWTKINNQDFATQYRLLFLSRADANSQWQVKGGYDWYDGNMSVDYTKIHIQIFSDTWIDRSSEATETPSPESKSYFGLWKSSTTAGDEGKEVFQDFQLWLGSASDKDQRMGMLGRTKGFDSEELINPGFNKIERAYKPGEGWVTYSKKPNESSWNGFDAKNVLKEWYTPFSGKKGKWITLADDLCTKRAYERDLDEKTLDQIKTVCAFKKSA